MRTAEEIINNETETHCSVEDALNGFKEGEYEYDSVFDAIVAAINTARKEAIEECAGRARAIYDLPNCTVDKQSILSLIKELN